MPKLIKSVTSTYIPGDTGQAYVPATITQPGYWSSEPQITCTDITKTIPAGPSDSLSFRALGVGLPIYYKVGSACVTSYVSVYHPATAGSDGIPYAAPTPAQINVSLNVGWNSYASSIGKLAAGTYLNYSIKMGTTGALLAVGYAGREGDPIGSFTHGLMTDVSSISVFENGVTVATLAVNQPTTQIRIARLTDGRIVYGIDTGVFHISAAPAYLPTEDLYVYGMLYSGYDEVSSSAFVAGNLLKETRATISGASSLTARKEQFVSTLIVGAGALVASSTTTANILGAGSLSAWVSQDVDANLAGVGTLWAYAGVSYPTTATLSGVGLLGVAPYATATISGVGALLASPFPTANISGAGSLAAWVSQDVDVSFAGTSRMVVTETYQGKLLTAAIVGASRLLAFANVGGRGYGELPMFVGLGGDTKYGQGRGDLPYFVSGETNGQSDYVPAEITRGYGNLPIIVGFARGVDIGIGTASTQLPVFVGLAGDYSYGFGSGSLPAFVGAGYGGFIPDDMLVLISPILGTMPLDQQIDLVMFLDSAGNLTSTLSMTREQALALLSALQNSSSFSMLGVYGLSAMSGLRAMSLTAINVGTGADLNDTGAVWVVNLDGNASVQYEQYGFNSFFQRGNDYYGVANDGIYKLSGNTDAGSPVNALVEFAKSNFGVPQDKTMPNVYLSASSDGALVLKVVTGTNTLFYTARSSSPELDKHRVDLGRGLQGMYWQFSVMNENGDDFNVAGMEFLPIASKRRI